jgi:hypothetical protein
MRRHVPLLVFLLFSLLNILIFLQRQHFEYKSYPDKSFLYDAAQSKLWSRYFDDYPAGDQAVANEILDTLPWQGETKEDILVLASFLRSRFENRKGVPSLALQSLTPVNQFQHLSTDKADKIWCGTWSNLFNYFALSRGITSRIVETNQPRDHHVFNEVWLPGENQWALVDLTNNFFLPKNSSGRYLNALTLAGTAMTTPVHAYSVVEGKPVPNDSMRLQTDIVDYYTCDYPFHYYERYRLEKIYAASDRALRYLWPRPWYHIVAHQQDQPGNGKFYLKQAAIAGLVLSLVWLGYRTRFVFKKDTGNISLNTK